MASQTKRCVPSLETGLIPIPTVLGKRIRENLSPKFAFIKSRNRVTSSEPASNSIPA